MPICVQQLLSLLPSAYESLIFVTLAVTLLVIIQETAPEYTKETKFTYKALKKSLVKSKVMTIPGFQKLTRSIKYFAIGWIISVVFVLVALLKIIEPIKAVGTIIYVICFIGFWIYLAVYTIMASTNIYEWVTLRADSQ